MSRTRRPGGRRRGSTAQAPGRVRAAASGKVGDQTAPLNELLPIAEEMLGAERAGRFAEDAKAGHEGEDAAEALHMRCATVFLVRTEAARGAVQ